MKPTQKQIDKYLKEVVNRKIPLYSDELKKKPIAFFENADDGNEMDKNLCSEESMNRAMALLVRVLG